MHVCVCVYVYMCEKERGVYRLTRGAIHDH